MLFTIGRSFTGTHRPTIYRAFSFHLISFPFILFHVISFIYFCFSLSGLGANQHFRRSDHSSTQRPGDRLQGSFLISHFFLSNVNDGAAGLYPIINKGIWLPALVEGACVFHSVILSLRYILILFQTGLIYESNSLFASLWEVICVFPLVIRSLSGGKYI